MLGFLHKRVLEARHPAVVQALPSHTGTPQRFCHNLSLATREEEVTAFNDLHGRSVNKYVSVYNRLAQELVDLPTVQQFQSQLTKLARQSAFRNEANWRQAYQNEMDVVNMFHPGALRALSQNYTRATA